MSANHIERWKGFFASRPQLNIQIEGALDRLPSVLVGYQPDRYLIITQPRMIGVERYIKTGVQVTVVHLHEGGIYGFKTEITGHILRPAPLVFLAYPARVELHELRNHERVDTRIPATLLACQETLTGVLEDISLGGCRFVSRPGEKSNLTTRMVGEEISLEIHALGTLAPLVVAGVIRSISNDDRKFEAGIEFDPSRSPEKLSEVKEYIAKVVEILSD